MSVPIAPNVVLEQFEGPLGLLLELVERNKMPVTDIAVATITGQYLDQIAHLDGLSPEYLSEFVQLGARLVYIKSLALLPTSEPDEQADELRELSRELAEYQRYQQAARQLNTTRPTLRRARGEQLPLSERPWPTVTTSDLAAAFQAVLKRTEPVHPTRTIAAQLSQADIIRDLHRRLTKGAFALDDLLASLSNRLEVVVTFSALLEVIRGGRGKVTQHGQFQPIMVEPIS